MSFWSRWKTTDRSEADAALVIAGTRCRTDDDVHRLAQVLLRSGGEEERTVLGLVGERADVLVALDRVARQPQREPVPGWSEAARRAFEGGHGGMVAAALASLHRDGRVREAATKVLTGVDVLPFVVLRTTDHVREVRDTARATLALTLDRHPREAGRLAGPALQLERRARAGYAVAQVTAALWALSAPDLRAALDAAGGQRARRFVFDRAVAAGALAPADLLGIALGDADWELRVKAAELVARDAVWTRQAGPPRELARSATPAVRGLGLTGLDRLGLLGSAEEYLVDVSASVRALARDAFRRGGGDPAARYRELVGAGTPPEPGALAGLGECGTLDDAAGIAAWLGHPASAGRREALRALDRLGGGPSADRAMALLTDPSADVIREASRALRAVAGGLPTEDLMALLAHDRFQVRRAAYSILRECHGWPRLRAALVAAIDDHPKLAHQGCADATWWARRDEVAHVPPRDWRRISQERLSALTTHEHAELSRLTTAAAPTMSPYAVTKLRRLLETNVANAM